MNTWCRLWHDMPTDPKWRTIAKRAGRSLPEVMAVFVSMMTNASANAAERGTLENWCDEDVAQALDMDEQAVAAIRAAMQGKVLDGERLIAWESGSQSAKTAQQSAQKSGANAIERSRTQPNANDR